MLDYVNWYLVELEQKLRHHPETSELILETRSHLDERVEELVDRGFDRSFATKRAIADFGDPDTIAWAITKNRQLKPAVFAAWAGVVGVGLSIWMIPAFSGMFGGPQYTEMWPYLTGPLVALIVTIFFAIRFRSWVGVAGCAVAATFVLLGTLFGGASGVPIHVPSHGQTSFVAYSAIPRQISQRQEWLSKSEADLAKMKTAFAQVSVGKSDAWKDLIGTTAYAYLSPIRSEMYNEGGPMSIPSDYANAQTAPWIRLGPSTYGDWALGTTYAKESAKNAWRKDGKAYLTGIETHRSELQLEIATLSNPPKMSFLERWLFLAAGSYGLLGFFAMFVATANWMLVSGGNAIRRTRFRTWQRRLV